MIAGMIYISPWYPIWVETLEKDVNNKTTRKKCEICSKLTIKTPERRQKPF